MTDYAGEKVTILVDRVRDGRGQLLDDEAVDSVTVTIYDAEGAEVQAEDDATWDATAVGWYYDWDTTAQDPGRYTVEVHVNSLIGPPGVEFVALHLARSPVPTPA